MMIESKDNYWNGESAMANGGLFQQQSEMAKSKWLKMKADFS
jgi:hypothetical protein